MTSSYIISSMIICSLTFWVSYSDLIFPFLITRTLEQFCITSRKIIRNDNNTKPLVGKSLQNHMNIMFGTDIHTYCRASQDEHIQITCKPFCKYDSLLVAFPERVVAGLFGFFVLISSSLTHFSISSSLFFRSNCPFFFFSLSISEMMMLSPIDWVRKRPSDSQVRQEHIQYCWQ